jgi:hypothetical protein
MYTRVCATAGWFALGAVWSGLVSGGIVFVTGIGVVILFHAALMQDAWNIHEFARTGSVRLLRPNCPVSCTGMRWGAF